MFSIAIELGSAKALRHHAALSVSPTLRGYAEESELRLSVGAGAPKNMASITALAIRRCPTGRDLYLERLRKIHVPSWERNVLGKVVDEVLVSLHRIGLEVLEDEFERSPNLGDVNLGAARAAIKERAELASSEILGNWRFPKKPGTPYKDMSLDEFAEALYPASAQSVIDGTVRALNALVSYEIDLLFRYAERCRGGIVGRLWSRGHTWVIRSVETLRILAEPGSLRDLWQRTEKSGLPASDWIATVRATLNRLQTEIRLDVEEDSAATFGLSKGIRPDFLYAVTLLGDLKLGADSRNYDRVATGYAIFAEYVLKRRINTSAILAVDLDIEQGMLRSHTIRMVHPGDELRMQWVTQRDMALSIFARPTEPIHPDDTAQCTDCHFRSTCWEHGTVGGAPILDGKVLAV